MTETDYKMPDTAAPNNTLLEFWQIMTHLQQGKRLSRMSWGERFFVFKQVPADIGKAIVPNMQSLPQAVKDFFVKQFEDPGMGNHIYYRDQFCFVDGSSLVLRGWTPSPEDICASDWMVLE